MPKVKEMGCFPVLIQKRMCPLVVKDASTSGTTLQGSDFFFLHAVSFHSCPLKLLAAINLEHTDAAFPDTYTWVAAENDEKRGIRTFQNILEHSSYSSMQ